MALLLALASSPTLAGAGDLDLLLFGSLDAASSAFVNFGGKLGFGALDRDGFLMLASGGAGRRAERGPDGPRTRYTVGAAAVLGYQWVFDWGVVAAYAGPEGTMDTLVAALGFLPAPLHVGLRLQGEVWARPTDETLLQAAAIAGTSRNSLWARLAWGYRLWGTYLGPELSLFADETPYRKWSFGLHGTVLDLGGYGVRASAGLQSETGRRGPAPYVALAVWSPW